MSTPKDDSDAGTAPTTTTRSAADIVAGLDLDTRIRILSGKSFWHLEPIPSEGLVEIMVTDGPHGLRRQETSADHLGLSAARPATCFPTAATLGSSWDEELLEEVGRALGDEARDQGVSVVLGPGLNLKRHPAGGRCFEYFSEDPLVSGRMAAAMVNGIQSRGVGTSIKHFAVNNQESHRLVVDTVVDQRTLREMYLRGFEIVVREASPWTVMCSYNLVNGTYASEHHELLTSILRDEWGFEGLVMTDWGAANDRVAGIRAGLDLEMPGSDDAYHSEIRAALDSGRLTEAELDACATRVVELIQRGQEVAGGERRARTRTGSGTGAADGGPDDDARHRLARRAAAAGTVMLRNEGLLPLATTGRIAVIGAFAETPRYQGAGSSQVTPKRLDDALSAIRSAMGETGEVVYAPGYDARTGRTNAALVDEALRAAASADVVVVFVGLPASHESEGFDRPNLEMPEGHERLVEAVAATGTPTAVVLSNGGVVQLGWAPRVDAILECWLGGQAGGSAVADVLFGRSEPGGRLAESIPFHVAQLPSDRNFPGEPRQVQYREGPYVGYRFHDSADVPAQFPFGFGLSYTTFEWSDFHLTGSDPSDAAASDAAASDAAGSAAPDAPTDDTSADDGVVSDSPDAADDASRPSYTVGLTVTNTGARAGSDVVQVYLRKIGSVVHRVDKELVGFAKVALDPGAHSRVEVTLDRRAFTVWDTASASWRVEPGRYEILVAHSSVDIAHTFTVEVESTDVLAPTSGPSNLVATDDEFEQMLGHAVPAPVPGRPFHRNSTLDDVSETRSGRAFANQVIRIGLKRAEAEFPDPDEATVKMFKAVISEGPLRSLVLVSGGAIGFETLDRLLEAFNGEWGELGRGLLSRARDAISR